jgi:hypothetical protein
MVLQQTAHLLHARRAALKKDIEDTSQDQLDCGETLLPVDDRP